MAFVAVHARQGRLDASQRDLGCGWDWAAVYRVRPRVPLLGPECLHVMHAKVSSAGLRFFAHDRAAPTCASAAESLAHHLLKLELATSVRAAGWHADLEIWNVGRTYRADVLASAPDGSVRMAWEAQLASASPNEIATRTGAYWADQVPVCWVTTADRPWAHTNPSVIVEPSSARGRPWQIRSGVLQLVGGSAVDPALTLPMFVDAVLTRRLLYYTLTRPLHLPGSLRIWPAAWVTPTDFDIVEQQALGLVSPVRGRTFGSDRIVVPVRRVPPQEDPSAGDYFEAPADYLEQLRQHLNRDFPGAGRIRISGQRDPRMANGYPVHLDGRLHGVACPHPDEPTQWQDLGRHLVFVPPNQRHWFSRTAPLGTRIQVVGGTIDTRKD